MQIHVARNGQQLGQFSAEEVNRKLADGTFLPEDLGWHEGAAGWAPLSNVAGVTMPAGPAIPPPPPPRTDPGPSMPGQPAQSSGGGASQHAQSYKGMAVASWILLSLTALLSVVPVLGFAAWFLAIAVVPVAFILAVVILTRGGKTQGIFIIVASLVVLPAFIIVAPLASTIFLGATVNAHEQAQEKQIMENLRALSDAKSEMGQADQGNGWNQVTVAGLAPYLDGNEIKSIVGEIYDPRPVGQEPTATLPATKSLARHKKGAVLTASGSSVAPDTTSRSEDLEDDDEAPSPEASPQQL